MILQGSINQCELGYIQDLLYLLLKKGVVGAGNFEGVVLKRNVDLEVSKEDIAHMIVTLQDVIDQGAPN